MPVGWVDRLRNAARVKEIVGVAIRFGFSHVVEQAESAQRGLFRRLRRRGETADPELARMGLPERLRLMLEALGPTFVKIGQLLSTRQDVIPPWAVKELRKLQDQVAPMPYETVREVLTAELGAGPETLFAEFAREPTASASLGQVHRAVLQDGAVVAVKIQRPGMGKLVERDLSVLLDLAELLEGRLGFASHLQLTRIVAELARSLRDELVYTIEGRNAERIAGSLKHAPGIRVPRVYWELTTGKVLTCEMLEGQPLSSLDGVDEAERAILAQRLARFVLRMILIDGFFHADPHPGNLIHLPDGSIGVVDWGMVGLLSRSLKDSLDEIFISIVEQDVERLTDEICHLGLVDDESGLQHFRRDLARALDRYFNLTRRDLPLSQVLSTILELSYEHKVQLPAEVPMLIKVLVTTEGTCLELDAGFELRGAFQPVVKEIVGSRLEPSRVARELASGLRTLNRLATDTPRQVHSIMSRMESGRIVFKAENQGLETALRELSASVQALVSAVLVLGLLVAGGLTYRQTPAVGLTALSAGLAGALVLFTSLRRASRGGGRGQ